MSAVAAQQRCRALVAGFGRPGMRDLDFGRQLVRYLEGLSWDEGVVVEDLSYAAPLVLHRLQELEPAKVVLVGAVARGFDSPGSLRRERLGLEPPRSRDVQRSLEESVQGVVDIDHTLAVARHYGALPSETVIIEVEPADCSFGPGFSDELAASFDAIVTLVREELDSLGDDLFAGHPDTAETIEDPEPSSGLMALVGYARQHEEARLTSRHRGPGIVGTAVESGGLSVAGRSRPWAVNLGTGGGDWFDVIPLQDGWCGCLVGDVTGRGVEATAEMADLRAAVRAYAIQDGCFPGRALDHLDRLAGVTGLGRGAALVYVAYRPATGELRLSNAGNCPPLLLSTDGAARLLRDAAGPPLGGPGQGPRPQARCSVPEASTILLFTDGLVTTAAGSTADGLERLRRAASLQSPDLDGLCDHVLDACTSGVRRDDDLCLLAVRAV
jgi:hydrogenase maturation protease